MRRVGFVKNRFLDAPSGSLIYRFINLVLKHDEIIQKNIMISKLNALVTVNGPYEKEYVNGIISLEDNLIFALNFFNMEVDFSGGISDQELIDLQSKML